MAECDIHIIFENEKWKVLSAVSEEHSEFPTQHDAEVHAEERANILKCPIFVHDKTGEVVRVINAAA